MKVSKQQIDRHRKDWEVFLRITIWCIGGISTLLIALRLFLV